MAHRTWLGALAGAALGAVAARVAYSAFTRRPPIGEEKTWTRTNHRGEPITLLEGPAFVAGAGAAAALAPGLPARARAAAVLATVGSGALGAYDDLWGATTSKGFKGHLTALARGEVTSGAVKILGIGAAGLAAAALLPRHPAAARRGAFSSTVGTLADGALIAGSANLANLFDLRPGRAIKVGLLTGGPLLAASLARGTTAGTGAALAAVPLGAGLALLPEDLGERAMLGDAGANALGALLGVAAVAGLPPRSRLVLLGAVAALTAASEKVSFTKVIAANPVLNRLDMLGRRPA
ncbi:hypothetical protein [Sphaerisporangium dianthi]|uniref:UDP-N-acetylmuramyl pentapeptide phosphotransferase/UDP-N-acetylglucosamine-1-phosphate transferase n=1 Tax=Sphaerisporangium dianthi TaxID=1436120 RepID=A0ABV9CIF6_9ACTN